MSARDWYLVSYDVRDDARLQRVARLLEGYGERVQYSVFRCRLTQREEERLRWEMTRLLDPVDAWLILRICDQCIGHLRRRNPRASWPADPPRYVVV